MVAAAAAAEFGSFRTIDCIVRTHRLHIVACVALVNCSVRAHLAVAYSYRRLNEPWPATFMGP